jgi:hypothetical protein
MLVILEPVVTFALAGFALLGILTILFFHFVGSPGFPAWTMLALSLSLVCALIVYHGLIRVLSDL